MVKEYLKNEMKQVMDEIVSGLHTEIEYSKAKKMFDNLSYSQLMYLKKIFELGIPTLSALAAGLNYSKPSATVAVAKLEKMGYVKKVFSKEDKRSCNLQLSAKGRRIIDNTQDFKNRLLTIAAECLSESELVTMINLHKKILRFSRVGNQ